MKKRSDNVLMTGLGWVILLISAMPVYGVQPPVCPAPGVASYPAYAAQGDTPTIVVWKNLKTLPGDCHITLNGQAKVVVAFAGLFKGPQSLEDIATSLGAVSATKGLKYWSVTDKQWRVFISDAFAVHSLKDKKRRQDFTAEEILSTRALYFAQDDTRSWGLNYYRIQTIDTSADHLTVASLNETSVRLGPITVFKAGAAQSVVFLNRHNDDTWEYFSLSLVKDSLLPVKEKSLINRQAALYRLLIGQNVETEPPLAP